MSSATDGRRISQFNFVCINVAEAQSVGVWIQEIEGVGQARMGIVEEYLLLP
jgi:hypothetical protein